MLKPLTSELLRERTSRMFDRVIAANGPVEEIIFEIVGCDGCGQTINLLVDEPRGWHTEGSFEMGWSDYCPDCVVR